jgi:hypothetical protein
VIPCDDAESRWANARKISAGIWLPVIVSIEQFDLDTQRH